MVSQVGKDGPPRQLKRLRFRTKLEEMRQVLIVDIALFQVDIKMEQVKIVESFTHELTKEALGRLRSRFREAVLETLSDPSKWEDVNERDLHHGA